MESRSAASGDDLQHPWADDASFDDDNADSALLFGVPVSEDEVLEHSPQQVRADVELLAERVRRHNRDGQLFEAVRVEGFCGRRWDRLAGDLAAYGWAVLDAWMRTGYIFAKVRDIGRPLPHTDTESRELETKPDVRAELCAETAARALKKFRDAGLAGTGWSPDGGASLTTFFVGACIQAFNNEFRRWSRHEQIWGHNRSTDPETLRDHSDRIVEVARATHMFDDPERAVVDADHFERVLRELSGKEYALLQLTDLGYSQEAIGELLGITERAVEGRLYRLRNKDIRGRLGGHGDD
ncbi:RNA polymerase sigma factor [Mycobacterium sp. 134]|uniref:RNA polymerase sigma factor n=1 Tax=Mycobacterium sp. 134 TaxID=3400425 RepID=UPI003AAAED06